jgi:hypothetical protein
MTDTLPHTSTTYLEFLEVPYIYLYPYPIFSRHIVLSIPLTKHEPSGPSDIDPKAFGNWEIRPRKPASMLASHDGSFKKAPLVPNHPQQKTPPCPCPNF